jgi:hypothetical protein
MNKVHTLKLDNFLNEKYDESLNIDIELLDDIVNMVGSEECVEDCAKEAYEELKSAFEGGSAEVDNIDSSEVLAVSSLIVKLVENGNLKPEQAEELLYKIVDSKEDYENEIEVESTNEKFSKRYDDNPKLKGKQKKLPDALQKEIVNEQGDKYTVTGSCFEMFGSYRVDIKAVDNNTSEIVAAGGGDSTVSKEDAYKKAVVQFNKAGVDAKVPSIDELEVTE